MLDTGLIMLINILFSFQGELLYMFYKWWKRGIKELSNFPKDPQLMRVQIWSQEVEFRVWKSSIFGFIRQTNNFRRVGLRIIQSPQALGQNVWPVSYFVSESGLLSLVVSEWNLEEAFSIETNYKNRKICSILNLKAKVTWLTFKRREPKDESKVFRAFCLGDICGSTKGDWELTGGQEDRG